MSHERTPEKIAQVIGQQLYKSLPYTTQGPLEAAATFYDAHFDEKYLIKQGIVEADEELKDEDEAPAVTQVEYDQYKAAVVGAQQANFPDVAEISDVRKVEEESADDFISRINPLFVDNTKLLDLYAHDLSQSSLENIFNVRPLLFVTGAVSGLSLIAVGATLLATTGGGFGWEVLGYGTSMIAPYLMGTMIGVGVAQLTIAISMISKQFAQFLNRHMWFKNTLIAIAIVGGLALCAAGIAALVTGAGAPLGLAAIGLGIHILNAVTGFSAMVSACFTRPESQLKAPQLSAGDDASDSSSDSEVVTDSNTIGQKLGGCLNSINFSIFAFRNNHRLQAVGVGQDQQQQQSREESTGCFTDLRSKMKSFWNRNPDKLVTTPFAAAPLGSDDDVRENEVAQPPQLSAS